MQNVSATPTLTPFALPVEQRSATAIAADHQQQQIFRATTRYRSAWCAARPRSSPPEESAAMRHHPS